MTFDQDREEGLKPKDELKANDDSVGALPTSAKGWFMEGLLSWMVGFGLLFKDKNLTKWFVVPIIIQTVISAAILAILYFATDYVTRLIEWISGGILNTVSDVSGSEVAPEVAEQVAFWTKISAWCIAAVVFIFLFIIIWRITGGILAGYFGGRMTDQAIQSLGLQFDNSSKTSFAGEIANGAFHSTMVGAAQLVMTFSMLVPFVGILVGGAVTTVYLTFLTGYGELRDPLEKMGHGKVSALNLCRKYYGATFGLGFSKLITEPMPLVGGIVQSSESLGRIVLAQRIMAAEKEAGKKQPSIKR